jgi:acyl-CoA synthetase (AMP-forming)/AMP-acid ligase II
MPRPPEQAHPLARRVGQCAAADPGQRAIEYDGTWYDWGSVSTAMARVDRVIDDIFGDQPPEAGPAVGVLVRNRPEHVAVLLAILRRGGCFVVINPARGADSVRADVDGLQLRLVIGTAGDIEALGDPAAGTALAGLASLSAEPQVSRPDRLADGPVHPGVAVRMLTSGTTGTPKRVDLTYDALDATMRSVTAYYGPGRPAPPGRPPAVAIVNSPLAHIGGVFRVLQCVVDQRPFVLLDRFEVEPWLRAVRTYRPRTASLVPTALRMVLEASPDPADLASLRSVTSGTAPLSPEDADAFTDRFGVPVLISYAATEFAGGVAGWTLNDYQQYWNNKRGSVGRATPGTGLRVVDPDSENVLGPDELGLLEVRPAQLGPDSGWLRTTDLARIDADGFLYILGRADGAIIRGGFKVLPDRVRGVLEQHPAVRGAAVLGVPHERLGAVPVALVELRDGASADGQAIGRAVTGSLAGYERPAEIYVVPRLPRSPSGKIDLQAANELLLKVRNQ